MRIITDGKSFAVAKGRWIFTRVLSIEGFWWPAKSIEARRFGCWTTLDIAKEILKEKKRKFTWKTYKEG